MRQFKPTLAVVGVLVVVIVGWTLWRQCPGSFAGPGSGLGNGAGMHAGPGMGMHAGMGQGQTMAAPGGGRMIAAKTPMGPPIDVKLKATHPYWGNCNKCHVTTGAGKPVSKVMQGPPIAIAQKMTHKDWGNCMLCHQVLDGFQPDGTWIDKPAAAAQPVALDWLTAPSLGLSVSPVTDPMIAKYKLAKEDALLVLDVRPGSLADKAGLAAGDEIVRVDKTLTATVAALEGAINGKGAGADLKFNISRGKTSRNLIVSLPKDLSTLTDAPAATQAPAAPLSPAVPQGLVAVASTTPDFTGQVAAQFESAPYFLLVDQVRRSYRVEANPNAGLPGHGMATGQLMANLGVGVVITGGMAGDALSTLGAQRIAAVQGVTGSVKDVLNAYQAGQLRASQAAAPQAAVAQPRLPAATTPQTLY